MANQEQQHTPTLRLRHARVGQVVCLSYDETPRTLLAVDKSYGYFHDGLKASRCLPLKNKGWGFGEGGWKLKEQ